MAQLPGLIENSEPQIESALRTAIQQMSTHPAEAKLFYDNWKKLNTVVDSELSKIVSPQVAEPMPETDIGGKKRKSSKKTRRHRKK